MFFVVVDGVFLAQVNKKLGVATPGSEGEYRDRKCELICANHYRKSPNPKTG